MKILAKSLTLITCLALLLAGYVVWKSDAVVTAKGYYVEAAADRAEAFSAIVDAYRNGDDSIVAYSAENIGGVDQYMFITYTVNVRNSDLLAMEWLDLSVQNSEGDILLIKSTAQDVPALKDADIQVTLMADRGVGNYERQAKLTYYFYGHYKEIPVALK